MTIVNFLDGSKDPESGKTGLGVYVASSRSRQSVRTSDHLSVFSVELLAILWALDWVEENKPPKSIICSDSAAALVALKEGTSRARPDLIWEILTCIFKIERSGFIVCFLWIPGHSGVEGNEISDFLAKLALSKETVELNVPLGKSECNSRCKEKLEHQWQEEWTMEKSGRHIWKTKAGWRDNVILTRMRLGQCGLAGCLKVVGKHPNGLCECGNLETVHHIMFVCNKYKGERQQLFKELSDVGLSVFSHKSIFGAEQNIDLIGKAVVKFLHSTGLYVRIQDNF